MFSSKSSPKPDHARIVAAIAAAEHATSAQIRVVISRGRVRDSLAEAQKQFERLGMTRTAHRNGVLILLAPRVRRFAVAGDTGIHQRCGEAFWRELTDAMSSYFKRGEFTEGLEHGIAEAGRLLAAHFPRQPGDGNDLPDRVEETG
jgi:uncharacterized membrane protein